MGKHALRLNQVHEGHPRDGFPSATRGPKRADLHANRIELALIKHAQPCPRASAERAESRIAERAATALLRAIDNSARAPSAFILDEEDLTIGPGESAAKASDALG